MARWEETTAHVHAGDESSLVSLQALALLVPGLLPALALLHQLLHLRQRAPVLLLHLRHRLLALPHRCMRLLLRLFGTLQVACSTY